jgi:hypothetical protein
MIPMRKNIYALIQSESGALYIDAFISLTIFIAILFSIVAIPEVFVRKQELDYIAGAVTRRIERDGMAGAVLRQTVADLKSETGLDADITWNGPFHGISSKIQIRDRFTVTVRYNVKIRLFEPSFSEPVFMDVPIRKTISGVSEVYWKDLS